MHFLFKYIGKYLCYITIETPNYNPGTKINYSNYKSYFLNQKNNLMAITIAVIALIVLTIIGGVVIAILKKSNGKSNRSTEKRSDLEGFENFKYKSSNKDWSSSYSQHRSESIENLK